jgi:hypothetical protein
VSHLAQAVPLPLTGKPKITACPMRSRPLIALPLVALLLTPGCGLLDTVTPETARRPTPVPYEQQLVAAPANRSESHMINQRRLAGEDAPKPTTAGLLEGLGYIFVGLPAQLIDTISGNTPLKNARKMEDPASPDRRREGIYYLSDRAFGRKPPYTTRYQQKSQNDPDYTVRVAAIRSLNRARDQAAVAALIDQLDKNPNEWVRTEAAKGLANIPDERAVPSLLRHLEGTLPPGLVRRDRSGLPTAGTAASITAGLSLASDRREAKDVRIACADALRNFHTTEVARALVNALQDRDFGVAYTARKSLKGMTGMDLGYDQATWLKYLTQVPKPFG